LAKNIIFARLKLKNWKNLKYATKQGKIGKITQIKIRGFKNRTIWHPYLQINSLNKIYNSPLANEISTDLLRC
jgi:hypothetical protein